MFLRLKDVPNRLLPILLSQCVGLACGIAGVKLATRWIDPADYGRYGVFLGFTPLGMWVVHAGLIKFVLRHWAAGDRPALWAGVVRTARRRLHWLALVSAGAAYFLAGASGWRVFPFVLGAAIALSGATLAQSALQAGRQHWRDLAVNVAGSTSRSFLPPLLYVATGAGVFALYGGFLLHSLILVGAAWAALWPSWTDGNRELVKPDAAYDGSLFTVLAAFGWLLAGVNRWLVAAFEGAEIAGYFTLAVALATIVTALLNAVAVQFVQPVLFALPTDTPAARCILAKKVDQVALVSWALSLVGLALLRGVMPWLVGPLVHPKYLPALGYIVPAGCFFVAAGTTAYFDIMLMAVKRERACGPVDLSAATVLILGGVIGAWAGPGWFKGWLLATPLLPWVLSRSLARYYYFRSPQPLR